MKNNTTYCCPFCGTIHEIETTSCTICSYEGKFLKSIHLENKEELFFLEIQNYETNDTKAVSILIHEKDEYDEVCLEPYAEITTNIEGAETILQQDEILVKTWSENESLIPALLNCGYFEDTDKKIKVSDWCEASIWKIKNQLLENVL